MLLHCGFYMLDAITGYGDETNRSVLLTMIDATQKLKTVEFAPIGIWKIDLNLEVVEANQAAGKLLGMASDELIGRRILELVPSLPKQLFLDALQSGESVSRKQVRIDELEASGGVGPRYWEMSLGPLKAGREAVSGLVLSTVEVTERELLRQQREDFIAALSHNLKSPLVGADMILNSLLRKGQGPLTAQQEESISLIKASNLHVLEMVQELVEVYRYETASANLIFEKLNLTEIVPMCLRTFENSATVSGITLSPEIEGDPSISGDRRAIRMMLGNLVDNAIKFTPKEGRVTVAARTRESLVEINISDTGCGIELEDPEVLFQRFWQGEPGKKYSAVTGLGLYLCRQIVTAHGGEIKVQSRKDEGTTFHVTLPAVI